MVTEFIHLQKAINLNQISRLHKNHKRITIIQYIYDNNTINISHETQLKYRVVAISTANYKLATIGADYWQDYTQRLVTPRGFVSFYTNHYSNILNWLIPYPFKTFVVYYQCLYQKVIWSGNLRNNVFLIIIIFWYFFWLLFFSIFVHTINWMVLCIKRLEKFTTY